LIGDVFDELLIDFAQTLRAVEEEAGEEFDEDYDEIDSELEEAGEQDKSREMPS